MDELLIEINQKAKFSVMGKLQNYTLSIPIKNDQIEIIIPLPDYLSLLPHGKCVYEIEEVTHLYRYKNPDKKLIEGLSDKHSPFANLAKEKIFKTYLQANNIFESLMRNIAHVYSIQIPLYSNYELFKNSRVLFSVDGKNKRKFNSPDINITRKNSIYNKNQLLNLDKLSRMQDALLNHTIPSEALNELNKIKYQLAISNNNWKLACLEAIIITEYKIRQYLDVPEIKLKIQNKNIKYLGKGEPPFKFLLDQQLRGILNNSEVKKMELNINNVIELNKVRNDIMHRWKKSNDINLKTILVGINAAIKLVSYTEKQSKH